MPGPVINGTSFASAAILASSLLTVALHAQAAAARADARAPLVTPGRSVVTTKLGIVARLPKPLPGPEALRDAVRRAAS